jgi:dipeptidyl aminopeptidase/acylaminoacyl peptidase
VRAAVGAVPSLIAARTQVSSAVVLSGHSAGGHLALWAARGSGVTGVVALAPVADLGAAYELDLDGGAVTALLGGSPAEIPSRYAEADPLARVPLRVPTVLVHGLRDTVVPPEFASRYAAAARAAGDDVRLHLPDADHFEVIDPQCPVWPVVRGAFAEVAPV